MVEIHCNTKSTCITYKQIHTCNVNLHYDEEGQESKREEERGGEERGAALSQALGEGLAIVQVGVDGVEPALHKVYKRREREEGGEIGEERERRERIEHTTLLRLVQVSSQLAKDEMVSPEPGQGTMFCLQMNSWKVFWHAVLLP